jgi:predicted transcriptional regulator
MYPNIEHEEAVDITHPEKIAQLEKIVNERIEKENFERELNRLKNKCSKRLEQYDCSDKEKEKYLHEIDKMIKNMIDDIDKNEGYSYQDILQFIKDTYVKDFTNVFESIKQENNNKENKNKNQNNDNYDEEEFLP